MAKMSKRMQQRLTGEVMDVDSVAIFLGFSTAKVRRLFEKQVIKAKKIGAAVAAKVGREKYGAKMSSMAKKGREDSLGRRK